MALRRSHRSIDTLSDTELIGRTADGDLNSERELWRRHDRAGLEVAQSFAELLPVDDLLDAAKDAVRKAWRAGSPPLGPFRLHLYATMRNVAIRQAAKSGHDLPRKDGLHGLDAKELRLLGTAFLSLPDDLRSVLWNADLELMPPPELARITGRSGAALAQLTFDARLGIRDGWLATHYVTARGECRRAIQQLPELALGTLSPAHRRRTYGHVSRCEECADAAALLDRLAVHFSNGLATLLLGPEVATALLSRERTAAIRAARYIAVSPVAVESGEVPIASALGAPSLQTVIIDMPEVSLTQELAALGAAGSVVDRTRGASREAASGRASLSRSPVPARVGIRRARRTRGARPWRPTAGPYLSAQSLPSAQPNPCAQPVPCA